MHYYEKLTLGIWRPRTTTLDAPAPGPTIRRVKQVDAMHRNYALNTLEAIYGNEAMIVKEAEEAAAKLQEVADAMAAKQIPPFQPTEAQRKVLEGPLPFTAVMNELIARLGLDLAPVRPGDLIGQALVPVLLNLADRIIALEQATPRTPTVTDFIPFPRIWVALPGDGVMKDETMYGWCLERQLQEWKDEGVDPDIGPVVYVEYQPVPTVDWRQVAAQLALAGSHAEDQPKRFGGDGFASGLTKALSDFDVAMKEEAGQ